MRNRKPETVEVDGWQVERRLFESRIEGRGPLIADECGGQCCLHGVYASLPERDKILAHADRIADIMDETQSRDTGDWFEDDIHEDSDYPGGLCIGTAVYNDKCAFLNADGLCVLQLLEPELDLAEGERLKPFYCCLFPLTTWYGRLEFDDMCHGVRPCCTLKADGKSASIDAFAYELQLAMGEEGYAKLCRLAADANGHAGSREPAKAESPRGE
ncbi:MAG: DUF3109 family protein [Gemmatimonadetes bacterium]|uniref:DUF3109 family protein n=1 Tax=Candidatus Kutchimonas denitrificans TaxID=3056748 RepID=A0AAE4Z6Z7_9BACT|nr:DUF3109 family protein [Gemmatimonadota bacterium]NIR74158.1 DUF3109 family protein [Candidatus Kutchimonas denitrificans]NIS01340.1 DUF3109 family protein [Gemmatimonadota bacterium]NIT67071.1 DUF3109 family protein [Gemmatimonadota bacterium]NIU51731.1 hypothetical protein [Gemmatimonadota bacterium]